MAYISKDVKSVSQVVELWAATSAEVEQLRKNMLGSCKYGKGYRARGSSIKYRTQKK